MDLQRTPITKELLMPLTENDTEWTSKSLKLLQLIKDEEELKYRRRSLNHEMKEVVGARNKTVQEMKDGSTYKDVECEEVKNFTSEAMPLDELGIAVPANHAVIVRLDTGEIIESRLLEWTECQMGLFPEGQEPAEADDIEEDED